MPLSSRDVLDARKTAISKDRFVVARNEKGQRGRFDVAHVHPLDRAPMLRRAEKISKTRPSNELYQLNLMVQHGTKEEYLNDKGAFEARSLSFAKNARRLLPDLSAREEILVALYGKYGLGLNASLRESRNNTGIYRPKSAYAEGYYNYMIAYNYALFEEFRQDMGLARVESVFSGGEQVFSSINRLLLVDADFAKVITSTINAMIDYYRDRYPKTGYFYRVSRALQGVYSDAQPRALGVYKTQNARSEGAENSVRPGDIIADWAMISATHTAENLLFRYSNEGGSASSSYGIEDDEEEVVFVIKNTAALKYMDISGHKFPKHREKSNSGELLIKSNTRFRVLAIQDKPKEYPRRVVHLEAADEYYENDIVHNMYDGSTIMGDEI